MSSATDGKDTVAVNGEVARGGLTLNDVKRSHGVRCRGDPSPERVMPPHWLDPRNTKPFEPIKLGREHKPGEPKFYSTLDLWRGTLGL